MNEYDMENLNLVEEEETRRMNKIVDKLEKRIATLEKVLASHAKTIGQLREDKNE
jgi:exonuclease VII small subunit